MTLLSVSQVLAAANAAVVSATPDVSGALARLLVGVTEVLPASAAAVLVSSDGVLDVLAASSHRVEDLEVHQAQAVEGPCVDCLASGETHTEVGAEAIARRWPTVGPLIVAAGYRTVHASPLTWHGVAFGALNLFDEAEWGDQERATTASAQALADAATLLIVAGGADDAGLAEGLRDALAARAILEQAKGALAHHRRLAMAAAFEALKEFAAEEGLPLGLAARQVMDRARHGTLN